MKKAYIILGVLVLIVFTFILTPEPTKYKILKTIYISVNDVEGDYRTISLVEVKELLDKNEAILLDVRGKNEIEKDGYIAGSINIPGDELKERLGELDKQKTYITFCTAGGMSAKAASILSKNNFENIFNAEEGMKSWSYEKIKN